MDAPQTYHRIHRFVGKHATVNMFIGKIITLLLQNVTTTFPALSLALIPSFAIFRRFIVDLNVNLIDTKSNILKLERVLP